MIEVINREILIPREEYNIGTCYDDNTETRHFHLKRVTSSGIDLAALTFNLDIKYANGQTDAASLLKEVTDKDINLTLTIGNSMLQVPGTVIIQIRALEEDGTCKWTSYQSNFFVEDHINTPGHYEGDLTQLEQYEAEWGKVRDNVNQLNSRMDEVVKIHDETPATEVEEEVIDGRVGYDGTQYESLGTAVRQQIIDVREDMEEDTADWTEALAAETTARTAADATLQGNINAEAATRANAITAEAAARATQDASLQSQIDQIIAPSGEAPSAAEVQNARIGADGVTYDTLGNAIRKQVTDLKNQLSDFNCVNFFNRGIDKSAYGITFAWQDDGSCTVSGTNTGTSAVNNFLIGAANAPMMPQGMKAGQSYVVDYASTNVTLRITAYNGTTSLSAADFKTPRKYNVPENATGLTAVLRITAGTAIGTETVKPIMYSTETNAELSERAIKNSEPTVQIPANSDLNTYTTPGQYRVLSAADAGTIENIPSTRAGQLIVTVITQYNDDVKTICQIYVATGLPSIYVRYYSLSSGFSDWRELADVAAIDSAVADLLTLKPISKTAVSSGDDLNTYLTPGQYRIPTTAIARSLKNKPVTLDTTGILIISNTHNDNHVYQTVYTNGFTGAWIRHIKIDEGIFNEWKSLVAVNGGYVWQESRFLIHAPKEETADMQAVFEEYMGQTITNTHRWATRANDFRNVSSNVIYSLWDRLQQEYSDYIDAGEVIGYSLDPNGENYQPVKAYYIHPRLVDGRGSAIPYNDQQTIYITAGTHGVESSPTWNLFAIFRRAFMTGTIYSEFLNGIKYRVVPCLSRWSYDHYKRYLAAAYNEDGTQKVPDADLPLYDANRMCICSGSTPSYSTLQIPLYATEAKALTDYLENHGFGANGKDAYLDLHNCSYSLGYMTSDNLPIRYAFNAMMDTLAKDWLKNATFSNGDRVDYYEASTTDHFALNGKILGHESVENSYAWFFEKAYSPYSSNILEVQSYDADTAGSSCNEYAIAKGLDITYRWLKYICDHIRG